MTMDLACLLCREHVRVTLGKNGRELNENRAQQTQKSETLSEPSLEKRYVEAATATGEGLSVKKSTYQGGVPSGAAESDPVRRCCRCDGLYHAKCVADDRVATQEFECAACLRTDSADEDVSIPPLLVPCAALDLLDCTALNATASDDDADAMDDYVVVTETIDVCATCRQVHFAPNDRTPCAQCHAPARVHRRCLGTNDESPLGTSRSPGRKRKRNAAKPLLTGDATVGAGLGGVCTSCDSQGPGTIDTRRLAVLLPKDNHVWWDKCMSCRRDFCLHPLIDEEEDSPLWCRIGQSLETGFQCRACSRAALKVAASTSELSAGSLYDPSILPLVKTTVDLSIEDEGTVLLCDGCEGEFEMAQLDPPLLLVPEGDWFCPSCQTSRSDVHQGIQEENAVLITLLICDGCEREFDMTTLEPPLEAVPDGDWYCGNCVATQDAVKEDAEVPLVVIHEEEVDRIIQVTDAVSTPESDQAVVTTTTTTVTETMVSMEMIPPVIRDEVMPALPTTSETNTTEATVSNDTTLIECDGCVDKFDITTIRPAGPEVPKGDWFCDHCEAARKRRKKGYAAMKQEKLRRLKAMGLGGSYASATTPAAPRPAIPRIQVEPRIRLEPRKSATLGLPLLTTVTLLICDGCEGEFDMATLDPPLSSVPRGDWYCSACVGSSSIKRKSVITAPCESCKTPVRWNRDAQRAARRRGETTPLCEPCGLAKSRVLKGPLPTSEDPSGRDEKKRKRSIDIIQHDGRLQVDPIEKIFAPVPVSVLYGSGFAASHGAASSASATSLQSIAASGHVFCSDDEAHGVSDNDDDHIIIVCEICLSEFNMIDVLGESLAPPPRPWYCLPCLRRLKKNRKKKQRISKQMMLEMQLYGGLLRPTAAKAVDPLVRALRGKKPSSEDELLALAELVGKRVGIILAWDHHWVLGRVLSFDMVTGIHLIRFDDDREQRLPLFAFPFVVGTSEMIEVMVPASRNRWWPAQVLKPNAIAERQLVATVEDPAIFQSVRLVCLVSSDENAAMVASVACWVPRHLCRALPKQVADRVERVEEDYCAAVLCALSEAVVARRVRVAAFKALLRTAQESGDDVVGAVMHGLVGCSISVNNQTVQVKEFDVASRLHRVIRDSDDDDQLDVFDSRGDVALEGVDALGKLQQVMYKAQRGIETVSALDAQQEIEPLNAEFTVLPSSTTCFRSVVSTASGQCTKCNLPPVLDGDTGTSGETSLVACVQCANAFHAYCCDPPHDTFPLVSRDDGAVLVDDIKTPFVCQACVTCAGCSTRQSSRWFRWRLPLHVVSLCETCVLVYDNKCQCAVCNRAFDDAFLADSPDLLQCASCDLWVHPQCEPDPHPAFRRRVHHDAVDFELDVSVPIPDLTVHQADQDDDNEDDAASVVSGRAANSSTFKTARLADEERALKLTFRDAYDARVLNNYECLCCRKVRLLRALHRLRLEDKLDLFKEPVTKLIAPTYFDVIKQPMDLATMQQRVLENGYTRVNFRDFRDDFELLCLNAVTFNSRDRDFLIWREAWRFYGQGQKILRLVAPKTRMKRRGGKHYDALVFAAKRQLPNNSHIGKTKLGAAAGSDGDDDDEDGDDEDEDDDIAEGEHEMGLREEEEDDDEDADHSVRDSVVSVGDHIVGTEAAGETAAESSAATTKMDASSAESSITTMTKPAPERKRLNTQTGISFTPQTELGLAPKPQSAVSFYVTMHSRSGAHAFCWVDACGVCGTRGADDNDMVFCVDCGEGFHTFCCGVDETKFSAPEHPIHAYWRCANCEMCELCGKPHEKTVIADEEDEEGMSRWMQCAQCDRTFHGQCLDPAIGAMDELESVDDAEDAAPANGQGNTFYCSSCVRCTSCQKVQPRASYSYDQALCLSCSESQKSELSLMSAKTKDLLQVWTADNRRQRKDAEKCPMCRTKWTTEDTDLIQCDACECWAHPQCDPVFVDDPAKYHDLVQDANAQYVCTACRRHERMHLEATPHLAKCQLFLSKIQRTRSLCTARWNEARAQMRQVQRWNEWKENLAIYLYVLRIGEECLKNLAYRSVNFQDDWARRSATHQGVQDVAVPAWLVQKAARYLRYKRYARGPRAAARKMIRKAENFYSQQGIDSQKAPHAIATVASQASSCAALIVCVHLLYGWAPVQRVVFHLLEREEGQLCLSLIKALLVDNHETLDDEIEKIKTQYERRAGKKHLLRLQAEDGDEGAVDEEISPTASSVASVGTEAEAEDTPSTAVVPADTNTSTGEDGGQSQAETSTVIVPQPVRSSAPAIRLTRAKPLGGGVRTAATDVSSPTVAPAVDDTRYCSLCFIVGESAVCGRLIYVELDQWVHLNCALWSSEVFEDERGVLQRCQKALSRSKTHRCDGCGVLGATLGCCVSRCPRHYHFPCALDHGVVFLPNGETCCPTPSHVQQVTKKRLLKDSVIGDESVESTSTCNSAQRQPDIDRSESQTTVLNAKAEEKEGSTSTTDEADNLGHEIEPTHTATNVVAATTAPLPWNNPLVKAPRHCVRVDFSSIFGDTKKRMNTLHHKRQVCFRLGALTVHSLGHIVIGNPSFYSRDAVYPLGFRSTRTYWSAKHLRQRCLYECVVTSTDVEARGTKDSDGKLKPFASPRALFKITASDDKGNPIVALSPTEALLEVRSRVVRLYEDARSFSSSSVDENPFLNRRSWFSYGLLGRHFFGFGVPDIAKEIEALPHAATTAIRRRFVLERYRQQQNHRKRRRGQESLGIEEVSTGDHVYVFSHRLPPATEMALAMREVEQVVEAEEHARLSSGAVRTDGLDRHVDEEEAAALRATRRRLNKDATRDSNVQLPLEKAAAPASSGGGADTSAEGGLTKDKPMDLEHLPIAMQYRELRRRPFSERLEVRKSKIHGYGLFTKEKFVEGQMIVEYQGQMIAQAVADVREKQYEDMGIGSCYMFRLDEKTIIDATRSGNLARFMNHSCDPKAFARVVVVENQEKKIVIFAKRTIDAFEEVTYDYKFPIEDQAIRCDCGAVNCIGRMN